MIHPRPGVLARALATLWLVAAMPTAAAPLAEVEAAIVRHADAGFERAVALLQRAVDIPSATENVAGVHAVGDVFAAELKALGFATRWEEQPPEVGRAGHLIATLGGGRGRPLLLLGHLDTVLQGEPFRREGARAYGSGASDMKAGDVVMVEALRALHAAGALAGRSITVVLTGDEERPGLPHATSRKALLDAARGAQVALAFEGYVPGFAVVGRRGSSSWRLEVEGRQAHSSGIFQPASGSGAVFELARILNAFHERLREPHVTFNPSVVVGGTDVALDATSKSGHAGGKTNVIARSAIAEGDLRYLTREQLTRTRARMREIAAASLPQTQARLAFEDGMPSMEPTAGNQALLRLLDQVSRDLGTGAMAPHDPSQRGAGDIAFLPDSVDRLDGLGALGDQEHAPGEWTDLRELPALTRRAALLIHRLGN